MTVFDFLDIAFPWVALLVAWLMVARLCRALATASRMLANTIRWGKT